MQVKDSMLEDIKLLKEKGLINNACLIYSMWEGYIDKEEKIEIFIEECKKLGLDYYFLHTPGHADINCMKMINKIKNPEKTMKIHTDNLLSEKISLVMFVI